MKPEVIMIGYLVLTAVMGMYLLRKNKTIQEHFSIQFEKGSA